MTALRRRLTFAYTVIVGAFIGFVAIVLTGFAFDAVVRPLGDSIQAAAREGRALVAAQPDIAPDALAARVRAFVPSPEVAVFVIGPPRFGPPPGGPPPDGGPRGFGPGRPPGRPPGFGPGPPPAAPGRIIESMLGVRAEFVRVGGTQVAIVPQGAVLEARAREYLAILGVLLLFAFVAAWLIARWIATAHVAAAFEERERAERGMRRFLADAGHELRTPLTIVTAYVDVLRKGGHEDANVRAQAFATLTSETQRMRRLVDRLVALARLEQPETTQPVVVDIGALAHDVVAAIGTARGGNVTCEVESGTFVLADPADVHEAIGNLVDNALKYGAGTPVRVAVKHERDAVVVRVGDGGPGIAPEDREKIFERFYRGAGRPDVEGSGLGLAIAARAAKRAGGELTLERSAPGATVFTLRLPLHVPASVG